MKSNTKLVIIACSLVLFFTACSKSDDTPPNTPVIALSASLNNINWSTSIANASMVYDTVNFRQTLNIGAGYKLPAPDTVFQGLAISLDSFYGIGTYNITKNGPCKAWFVHDTKQFQAKSGQVTVRSYSIKQVTGEFSFVTDTITISSGQYNLHVQ